MKNEICNSDNTIDSRDVIARLKEVTEEIQTALDELNAENETEITFDEFLDGEDVDLDLADEYKALTALCAEGATSPSWLYGETLINEDYFTEYAEELARDCGMVQGDTDKWPYNHVDWDAAAGELKQDYTEIDYCGQPFYIRA